jgi:opacity protein-like surface antigen
MFLFPIHIRKLVHYLIAISINITSNCANADNNYYYLSADYALPLYTSSNLDKKYNFKSHFPNFDLAIGKKIQDHYRVEFSAGYRSLSRKETRSRCLSYLTEYTIVFDDSHKIYSQKYMLNHYVDLPKMHSIFIPYMMSGFGISHTNKSFEQNTITFPDSSTYTEQIAAQSGYTFAYQFGLGFNIETSKNSNIDLGIKYLNIGKTKFTDGNSVSLRKIESTIGLKYKF